MPPKKYLKWSPVSFKQSMSRRTQNMLQKTKARSAAVKLQQIAKRLLAEQKRLQLAAASFSATLPKMKQKWRAKFVDT